MKDTNKLNPEIRFSGFTDDWEQRKLGEISRMYQPLTITGNDLLPDGVPVFGANGFIGFFSEANHIDDQVTISARGEGTGTPSYVHGPVWITGNSMVVNVGDFDIDKYFLFANLTANSLKKYVTGGAQPQLTRDVLVKVPITLPNTDEQKKIGAFFKQLDDTITLHQRKLNGLKNVKKAMLEKMFPKNGESVPEIRFSGFTDDWEQRKFGDVGTVAMCKRIFKEQTSEEGDIPFYKIGTFGGVPDAYISRELFEEYKNTYQYPSKGDILISASGSIGRTVEYTGEDEYFQDSNIVWLKHGDDIYNAFLKVLYSVVEWSCEGSTIKRLYNDNFLKTEFSLPNIKEQIKIGEYFSHLDNLITLHQRKLDKLKTLKKAMLEKMFI